MDSMAGGSLDTSVDCDAEEPEDSSHDTLDTNEFKEDDQQKQSEDPLAEFREQWQRELVKTPSPQRQSPAKVKLEPVIETPAQDESEEEKAIRLFLRGIELERSGQLYEAVRCYRRAVQLQPDVERRLYEQEPRHEPETHEESSEEAEEELLEETESESESSELSGDLLSRLQRRVARKGRLCDPAQEQKCAHLSWLPYEVVQWILRWVVSGDCDAASLERAAAACRGLYVAARDHDIWRALCLRTWGLDCGSFKSHGFTSWRQMYIERPRLRFNGCYISKTTYLRHGENSFQDQTYRPWYLIEYYRYLRFFPEGLVLMWTTADEPSSCVSHLKSRTLKGQGILSGHYRLINDKVIIVLKKQPPEKKPAQSSNTRFRSRRRDSNVELHEQTFHLELQLRSVKARRNWQLAWRRYSVHCRGAWAEFDLLPSQYPPFAFSAVRNYTAEAHRPLD